MEWSQLSKMEASWVLSSGQKAMLAESILQKAHAPRTLNLSILKPILVTAAVALILLGGLLLWGQRPMEEQIVTIPGASSEAKPGEYIEKQDPAKEEISPTPPKEEGAEKPPAAEEKVPAAGGEEEKEEKPSEKKQEEEKIHRFWETEKEMPYEEAVAIVKEKLENRPHETLTDKERMAYYQCISNTLYTNYLQSLADYDGPPNPESLVMQYHSKTKNPFFRIEFITANEGVGVDLLKDYPLVLNEKKYMLLDILTPEKIKEVNENSYSQSFYVSFIEKENGTILDTFYDEIILEHGTGRGFYFFAFNEVNVFEEAVSKETIQEIVRHYLSIESITWINITCNYDYKVIDE